jgi:hypothetical protein
MAWFPNMIRSDKTSAPIHAVSGKGYGTKIIARRYAKLKYFTSTISLFRTKVRFFQFRETLTKRYDDDKI